ncbi:hypothetical protein ACS0TY_020723 [Phlomoides rotata]
MALARLALKSLQQRAPPASFLSRNVSPAQNQGWASQIPRRLSSAAEEKPDSGCEVAVADRSKKSRRKRRGSLWRSNTRDNVIPALWGNALLQATDNINRLMETFSPSQLMGRAREHHNSYKLQYHMSGLAKEDVKITINDGVLSIRGEHRHEEEVEVEVEGEESDDEFWSTTSYGYLIIIKFL